MRSRVLGQGGWREREKKGKKGGGEIVRERERERKEKKGEGADTFQGHLLSHWGLFFRLTLGHVGTETVGWEDSRQSMNRESLAIDRGECEEKIRSGWMLWTKCHPKLIH